MKIIGITGTSGSGKTTVSEILNKNNNVKIIDADKVSKSLNSPGTEYMLNIEKTFGREYILNDGNLNRKMLANLIYYDEEAKNRLNELTFKYVTKEILNEVEKYRNQNENIVVIDAPLLFESKLNTYCNYVIAIVAEEELKVKRICKRDNIDPKTAISRLRIQHKNDFYSNKADFCIENNENCNLEFKVNQILDEIMKY